MVSLNTLQSLEKYVPLVGDMNIKTPLAYTATRGAVE